MSGKLKVHHRNWPFLHSPLTSLALAFVSVDLVASRRRGAYLYFQEIFFFVGRD
jgi:hypothetical protein